MAKKRDVRVWLRAAAVALALCACAPAATLPPGCGEADFAALSAQCVAAIRMASPTLREAMADECVARINEKENSCFGQL